MNNPDMVTRIQTPRGKPDRISGKYMEILPIPGRYPQSGSQEKAVILPVALKMAVCLKSRFLL